MFQEIITLLRSPFPNVRIQGWGQLRQDYSGLQTPFSPEQWEKLTALLLDEEDADVHKMAIVVLLGFARPQFPAPAAAMVAASAAGSSMREQPESLAYWLWRPFKSTSAVFSLSDPNYRRRDEVAIVPLARHLCRHEFKGTDIHFMQVDDRRWDQLLFDKRYQALCFVGRMGIFGDEAASRWGNKSCRFGFSLDHRPPELPPGNLHPDYHCITERLADGSYNYHPTTEDGHDDHHVRMDYGLVQRYMVSDGSRRISVVNCCGGSALGTLGAAIWATSDLADVQSSGDDGPLPTPPGVRFDSVMEALVYVVADITGSAWHPKRIELRKLYVGRHEWSIQDRRWKMFARVPITAVMAGSDIIAVWIDGVEAGLRRNSQNFRLLVAILKQVLTNGSSVIDEDRLAKDKSIWGNKKKPTSRAVRQRLANLRFRVLKDCLEIGDEVTLRADVNQVQAGAVSSNSPSSAGPG